MSAEYKSFLRFILGGAANTAITYALFVGLLQLMPTSLAYSIAYVSGIALSYLINTFLVFRTRASLRSAVQFPGVYLAQYLLGLIILAFLSDSGLDTRVAMLVVIGVNIPMTFFLTRFVVRGAHDKTAHE